MKKIFFAMIALSATVAVSAQSKEFSVAKGDTVWIQPSAERYLTGERMARQHRFGIGVRGGTSTSLQAASGDLLVWNGRRRWGAVAALDLEYTFLAQLRSNTRVSMGVRTGLSAVYAYNSVSATEMVDQYFVKDNENPTNNLLYTVFAQNVRENESQLMVEIPVLMALRSMGGFMFATGPKINLPVGGWYKLNYTNPDITAYYIELGVPERNQVVTGYLTEAAPQADTKLRTPLMNLLWNIELGYEWTLKNNDGLALTAFVDAPILNVNYEAGMSKTHFIQVGAPKTYGPEIKSYSIMNSYGTRLTLLDLGVKLTYNFNFTGKK